MKRNAQKHKLSVTLDSMDADGRYVDILMVILARRDGGHGWRKRLARCACHHFNQVR